MKVNIIKESPRMEKLSTLAIWNGKIRFFKYHKKYYMFIEQAKRYPEKDKYKCLDLKANKIVLLNHDEVIVEVDVYINIYEK